MSTNLYNNEYLIYWTIQYDTINFFNFGIKAEVHVFIKYY